MSFAWPLFLWLLPIPFLLLLTGLLWRRRAAETAGPDRILRGQAGAGRVTLSETASTPVGRRVRPLLCLCCAGLLLGLARPQWGIIDEPVYSPSREILIGLDLSRSMLATDIKPSRLERSKLLVQSLLDRLRGERIGLVVFSGTSFLQSPLSTDYEIMRDLLPSLGPNYLPEGGTAYKALLRASLDAFSKTPNTDRFLIVLSDGEALDEDWKPLVSELKERRVRVLGLGVGTSAGSLITDETGALVKDERGAAVLSKLEPATLESLARDTGGRYREAGTWIDLATLLRETVESAKPGEMVEKQKIRLVERFQWPLAFSLVCGLLSLAMEFPGRIRPRQLRIQSSTTKAASLLLIGLILWPAAPLRAAGTSPTALVPPNSAATQTPAPAPAPEPPLLGTVRKLSGAPTLKAEDCQHLAEETISWGKGLRSGRQAFPLGPINDALEAVTLGEKLDHKAAEWAKLRDELKLLQQPEKKDPEQQKQEQQKQDQQDKKDQDKKQQDNKDQPQEQNQNQQKQDKQPSQEKSSQPPSEQKQEQQQPSQADKQPQKQEAFGKMPPPPPQPQEEMQQVSGAPTEKQESNEDPNLVVPLEKLQKLKSQDSPGRLFELMQDEKKPQPTNKKNW